MKGRHHLSRNLIKMGRHYEACRPFTFYQKNIWWFNNIVVYLHHQTKQQKKTKMNGVTRIAIGIFWLVCSIALIPTTINQLTNQSTTMVVGSGFLITIMIIIGSVIACGGVERMQRGE